MSFSPAPTPRPSIEQMLNEMRACAHHLERGQAEAPLTQQVDFLLKPLSAEVLTIIVAATDVELAARAAGWMSGTDQAERSFHGLVELPMQVGARATHLVFVNLNTGHVPTTGLLARLLGEPCLLFAVTAQNKPLTSAARETLELLSANCCCHVQANFQDAPNAFPLLALPGIALEPITVIPSVPAPAHLFDDRSSNLRGSIASATRLRRALAIHDMLHDREQTEVRLLQSRQKRDLRIERAAPAAENDDRRTLEGLKAFTGEEFSRVTTSLRESGRRAGLRGGEMAGFLDQLISSLRTEDLNREEAGRKLRLRLREQAAEELKERFAENLKALIGADVAAVSDALTRVEGEIDRQLGQQGIVAPVINRPKLQQLWEPIEEGLHIDTRYRGEMPKRGFLQRLGEGRRVIFLFLMAGSLVGGFMGFNIRRAAGMGPVFLLLFLAVVGYTFYSWKDEDKEILDNELSKLKDVLSSDFTRLLQDALRERQTRLQTILEDARREAMQVLEAIQREVAASVVGETEF